MEEVGGAQCEVGCSSYGSLRRAWNRSEVDMRVS